MSNPKYYLPRTLELQFLMKAVDGHAQAIATGDASQPSSPLDSEMMRLCAKVLDKLLANAPTRLP